MQTLKSIAKNATISANFAMDPQNTIALNYKLI